MSELTEEERSKIQEGRSAGLAYSSMHPILGKQEQDVVRKIKFAYRAGDASHLKLLAFAAELCTLEDIENTLKAKINVADTLSKKGDAE